MEGSPSTPKLNSLKNAGTNSTSSLLQHRYLPSRYAHERNQKKNCFQDVLNCNSLNIAAIESNLKTNEE